MKVFVAGATGALGSQLVPMLAEEGHQVTAMTRTPAKQELIRELGARPVVADALDPEAVAQAVAEAEPEVVIHQLTAIDAGAMPTTVCGAPSSVSVEPTTDGEAPWRCRHQVSPMISRDGSCSVAARPLPRSVAANQGSDRAALMAFSTFSRCSPVR